MCVYAYECSAHADQEGAEQELQGIGSHQSGVLETELRSSERVASC